MASLNIHDLVIFLLVIQSILGQEGCQSIQTTSTTSPSVIGSNTDHKNLNQLDIRQLILKEVDATPESEFEFDTKLVQIVDENKLTTNYFLVRNFGFERKFANILNDFKPLLVISRNFIDSGQSVVILNKGEDGLGPLETDVFVVLKKVLDSGDVVEYFASLVYLRTEEPLKLEWDIWIPRQSFKTIIRTTSFTHQDYQYGQVRPYRRADLLDEIAGSLKNLIADISCDSKTSYDHEPKSRIVKRGLFDGVFQSVIAPMHHNPAKPSEIEPSATKTLLEYESNQMAQDVKALKSKKSSEIPPDPFVTAIQPEKYRQPLNPALDKGDSQVLMSSAFKPHIYMDFSTSTTTPLQQESDRVNDPDIATPVATDTDDLTPQASDSLTDLSVTSSKVPEPVVRIAHNCTKSKQKRAVSKKVPQTQRKELLSNRIYLVKPLWYPPADQIVKQSDPQGRSVGPSQTTHPFVESKSKSIKGGSITTTRKGGTIRKTSAVANSRTKVGKASAKALNKQGGLAISNAQVGVKGDAYASAKSVGKSQGDNEKVALANSNVVNGGTAIAKAETDGYTPTASVDDRSKTGGIPDPYAFLKETDKDFKSVLDISSAPKSKRSIGLRKPEVAMTIPGNRMCLNLERIMDSLDDKFFAQYLSVQRKYSFPCFRSNRNELSEGFKKFTHSGCDQPNPHLHNNVGKNSLVSVLKFVGSPTDTETENASLNLREKKIRGIVRKAKMCSSKYEWHLEMGLETRSQRALKQTLKRFNLECDNDAKSYIEQLLKSQSVTISENNVLQLESSYSILKKQKLSMDEIRNLTSLTLISSYTSALQKLAQSRRYFPSNPAISNKLELLTLTINHLIYMNQLPWMEKHKVKISHGISWILESILIEIVKNSLKCNTFQTSGDKMDYDHGNIENNLNSRSNREFQIVLSLLRFSQSGSLPLKRFNSVDDVTKLFWKYYSNSYPILNQMTNCLMRLEL